MTKREAINNVNGRKIVPKLFGGSNFLITLSSPDLYPYHLIYILFAPAVAVAGSLRMAA